MKLAIMQPYLFPYIGYFQLIAAAERFVVLDDVNHIKRGWVNRNRILVRGEPHLFTLPLRDASQNRHINTIELAPSAREWQTAFMRTLELNYRKAPEFPTVFELCGNIVMNETLSLADYLRHGLQQVCAYLKIATAVGESSAVFDNQNLAGQERIIDICPRAHSGHYLNPIGGMEIYNRNAFAAHGIRLNFIQSGDIRYKQFDHNFVPWLSIIDIMMFNPVGEIGRMLNLYTLV